MSLRRKIFNSPVIVEQYTGLVVDKATITATLTINRQPSEAAYLFSHFNDLLGTGSMTITGKDQDNVNCTDILTISNDKPIRTSYMYKSITTITTTGISGKTWITANDSSHEELRILKNTLTQYTSPRALMMIQIRDIRDVDVIQMPSMGFEAKTSHLGFCFKELALVLNQLDVVTNQYEVEYKVVYIDMLPGLKWWQIHHAEVGLLQLGSDING